MPFQIAKVTTRPSKRTLDRRRQDGLKFTGKVASRRNDRQERLSPIEAADAAESRGLTGEAADAWAASVAGMSLDDYYAALFDLEQKGTPT